jgi:hypothetical protein
MARTLPAQIVNALSDEAVTVFFAVDIMFDSGPLYIWTGQGDLTYSGKAYLGAGQLIGLSTLDESSEIEAKGASVTVTGIPPSFLSLALSEPYQGRECRIYFGVYRLGAYYFQEIFTGELDQMNIVEEAETAAITVTVENVLIKLDRAVVRRFTDQDQKSRYPLDRGLEYIAYLQDKDIPWGRK